MGVPLSAASRWCYLGETMGGTTSLKLPRDLKEKVSELAHAIGQTPHAYMVEAIAEKVARDEKRREFIESGLGATAEFKRTGVAYSHQEAVRYARARAKGKKARRPKPIRIPAAQRT